MIKNGSTNQSDAFQFLPEKDFSDCAALLNFCVTTYNTIYAIYSKLETDARNSVQRRDSSYLYIPFHQDPDFKKLSPSIAQMRRVVLGDKSNSTSDGVEAVYLFQFFETLLWYYLTLFDQFIQYLSDYRQKDELRTRRGLGLDLSGIVHHLYDVQIEKKTEKGSRVRPIPVKNLVDRGCQILKAKTEQSRKKKSLFDLLWDGLLYLLFLNKPSKDQYTPLRSNNGRLLRTNEQTQLDRQLQTISEVQSVSYYLSMGVTRMASVDDAEEIFGWGESSTSEIEKKGTLSSLISQFFQAKKKVGDAAGSNRGCLPVAQLHSSRQ